LILKKFEGYYGRFYVRGCGLRVNFGKVRGLFYKMTGKRPIYTVSLADPTARNGGRRGHVPGLSLVRESKQIFLHQPVRFAGLLC
jgi:hypothetical protein